MASIDKNGSAHSAGSASSPQVSSTKLTIKELEHLAELARIELTPENEEKFLQDFEKILNHFAELQEVQALPASALPRPKRVVLREDGDTLPEHFTSQQQLIDAFPEKDGDYLKVPPIFE